MEKMKAIIEGFGSIEEILHYSGVPTSLESLCFWGDHTRWCKISSIHYVLASGLKFTWAVLKIMGILVTKHITAPNI